MSSTPAFAVTLGFLGMLLAGCGHSADANAGDTGVRDTGVSEEDATPGDGSRSGGPDGTVPEGSSDSAGPSEAGATMDAEARSDAGARADAGTLPTTGTSVTACQTLGTAGTTYVLKNDVTAPGTCFSVTADDITLNLNGHSVTYGTASQSSDVVAGVMMVECWESAWGSTITTGSGAACGSFQGFTIGEGAINQGGGTLQSGSHVIRAGGNGSLTSGPTVFGVTSKWSAPYSQFITTDYGNDAVAGKAVIHDNVLTNDTAAKCGSVGCRDMFQSASILLLGATATLQPAQIFNNTVNGGPQGGIACDAPGCLVYANFINPGNPAIGNTNDFAIWCLSSCDAHDNVIMTPPTASSQGRGMIITGTEGPTKGANAHNNTILAIEKANNLEYGGCPLGGAYGFQFDDNGNGGTAQGNDVTALADVCWGTGLRLTDTETTANVSMNSTYVSSRQASTSPSCSYIGGGAATGCAHAVAMDGPLGFSSAGDRFQGDSDILFFDWDGASGVTLVSPTFLKGTTHPSPDFHTFVFRNGGTSVANIHVQDATFGAGTGATDTDLPAQGGNNQAASLFIDWSETVTVTKSSGGAATGATVTFTDAEGHTYEGTTDSKGVSVVVVTQYRLNNDSGANGVEDHDPYARSVTLSGCSASSATGLSLTATGKVSVVLSGC